MSSHSHLEPMMTSTQTTQPITHRHLEALFNLGGILILDADGAPLAVGRRLAAGERFLATADAAYALFRRVGSVEETAAALSLALAGTARGPLL